MICLPEDRRGLLEIKHLGLSIREQCELLDVSRSSVYYKPRQSQWNSKQLALLKKTDEVYTQYPFFGTRQMASYLKRQPGWGEIKRHHTRWAYEKLSLQSVAPGPHTSRPHPEHKIYPYLLRNLCIKAPNHVWSTDLTYINIGPQNWTKI